jgi:hypothetical protein
MLNWNLLRSNSECIVELWQTPTKYLVCQKYLGIFHFYENPKEAMDHYFEIVRKGR